MARAVRVALDEQPSSAAAVRFVWEALWTQERRRQVGDRARCCPCGVGVAVCCLPWLLPMLD